MREKNARPRTAENGALESHGPCNYRLIDEQARLLAEEMVLVGQEEEDDETTEGSTLNQSYKEEEGPAIPTAEQEKRMSLSAETAAICPNSDKDR